MPIEWSDQIVVAELADEPAFSEEMQTLERRVTGGNAESPPHLVLNLATLTHLSSSNIAQLIRVRGALIERSRRLIICCLDDHVWSIILVAGLDTVFEFAPDTASAIASLQLGDVDEPS